MTHEHVKVVCSVPSKGLVTAKNQFDEPYLVQDLVQSSLHCPLQCRTEGVLVSGGTRECRGEGGG